MWYYADMRKEECVLFETKNETDYRSSCDLKYKSFAK